MRLLFFILIILCVSPLASGQTLNDKLNKNVEEFDSTSPATIEQLVELAQKFQIPMGIEWLYVPNEKPANPIHIHKALVQDIISQILKQQPDYQFTVSDGVVHIFQPSLINDSQNFLNLSIPTFKAEKESLFGANYKLKVSIEQLLHPTSGFGGGYGGVGLNNDFNVPRITFYGTNLTVRQILNKIVAMQGNSLWVIRLKRPQMMTTDPFYAQTASLTSGDTAPDFFWQFVPLINRGDK